MKRILLYVLLLSFGGSPLLAQQLPLFSLYKENAFVLNPGIAGSQDHGIATATYRRQWTKIDGAPQTVAGSFSTPLYNQNIGLGGYLVHDQTGPTSYTSLNAAFAYHISFAKINPFHWAAFLRKSHLSIGLSMSLNQYRLNANELLLDQPNDPSVTESGQSKFAPNAAAGIYFYYDKFYIGYSSPTIMPLDVNFQEGASLADLKREIHHYVTIGGKIPFGEDYKPVVTLEPMIWFKTVKGAPWQLDAYVRGTIRKYFWVGVGFRTSMTIVADAGFIIRDHLYIGYAYDQNVSDIRPYTGTSHEISISYHLNPIKKRVSRIR